MTWTPGPWEHDGKFTVTIPVQTGEYAGLEYPFRVTRVDDACLIALAPEMGELLKGWYSEGHFVCDYDEAMCVTHEALFAQTRALLARTGEA